MAATGPAPDRGSALLEIRDLSVHFGGLRAVSAVSLSVAPGEILSVIGPNGAGKTTIFNVVTGLYRPTAGTIALAGTPIATLPPHARARLLRTVRQYGRAMGGHGPVSSPPSLARRPCGASVGPPIRR